MDPLSLTASILTVAGVSAQCAKLLKTVCSLKDAPRLVLDLDDELSNLRRDVFAIQELFNKQSQEVAPCSNPATLDQDTVTSMIIYLEQANALVIELDSSLSPLLVLLLRSDSIALKRWFRWVREERRLKAFKEALYNVRTRLNTALGILDWSTSMRLEGIAYTLRNDLMKMHEDQAKSEESHRHYMVKLETFMEPMARILPSFEMEPILPTYEQRGAGLSLTKQNLPQSSETPQCQCHCHHRRLNRSPPIVDRIFGTVFASYSGVSRGNSRCDVLSCAQSCANPEITLSLTYFFPPWLLSGGINVTITQKARGLNNNLRVIQCVDYSSPIFRYAYEGDVSRMKALLRGRLGSPFDVTSGPQRSLLGVAASRGHGEICDILLHEGADPFLVDYQNRSAVDIAWEAVLANNKAAKSLTNLIALSNSDNYVSKMRMGLLHQSVLSLNCLEIKPLIESIPAYAIDEKDAEGRTPLYWAARRGDVQAVSLLLEGGADKNSKNNCGAGILTAAIMSSNTKCIRKLLESKCDIDYRQKDGYTPMHHCCRYNVNVTIIKAFLDRGADANAQTVLGHTPLMIAAFNTLTTIAQFLIDSKIDLDVQCKDGCCALHYAVMSGDHNLVRHLLDKGANHLLKTNNGETLLHFLAQRNGDYEMIRCVELFDLRDINVGDVTRKQNLTALQIAEMHHECDAEWLEMFRGLITKT